MCDTIIRCLLYVRHAVHTGEDPGAGVFHTGAPVLLYFGPMLTECLEQVTLSPHASVSSAVNGYRLMYKVKSHYSSKSVPMVWPPELWRKGTTQVGSPATHCSPLLGRSDQEVVHGVTPSLS